jgi:hypothetical protein
MSEGSEHSANAAEVGQDPQRMSLTLSREVTCIRSLAWRCDVPAQLHWDGLCAELQALGLAALPATRGLLRFGTERGDEIVVVSRSGRVQLRVHYTVPEEERRFAAERLFQLLVTALRRL